MTRTGKHARPRARSQRRRGGTIRETFERMRAEAGGICAIRFVSPRDAMALLWAGIAGDAGAMRIVAVVEQVLGKIEAMRRRGERPDCFICGKPVRRNRGIVVISADTTAPPGEQSDCIAGVIGDCCAASEAEMVQGAVSALNETIGGDAVRARWRESSKARRAQAAAIMADVDRSEAVEVSRDEHERWFGL